MTNAWLRDDATVVPIDYATYCAAEVARDAALFLVDHREQFLANRDAGNFDGYPDPMATHRRGDPRGHAAARRSGRRDAPRRRARGPRLRGRHRPGGRRPPAAAPPFRAEERDTMRRAGALRRAAWCGGSSSLIAVLVSLAIVALVVLGAVTTQRGWPQTTGPLAVAGPQRARDRHPRRLTGSSRSPPTTQHDLFLAQGYVHAQERMWQMEISRRIGAGRLSELFGKSQVDTDTYIRTLGWRVAAQRDLDALSPDEVRSSQAYADGVNAWIAEHDGRLSTPFVVARPAVGRWRRRRHRRWSRGRRSTPTTWQKVQAWSLGGNVDCGDLPAARRRPPRRSGEDR